MSTHANEKTSNRVNGSSNYTIPIQIDGKEVTTEHTFDVINPATGKLLWASSSASKNDSLNAIEAARTAYPAWSKTKPSKRRDILLKAAEIVESRANELGGYMMDETGAVEGYATYFNVPNVVEMLRDVAGRIVTATTYMPVVAEEGKSALVFKEPYGVVLGIAPWYDYSFRPVPHNTLMILKKERPLHPRLPRRRLRPRSRQHYNSQRSRALPSLLLGHR